MHPILDDPQKLIQFDSQNLFSSITSLPEQCQHAFSEASKVVIPRSYSHCQNLDMCGMGGSGLAARIVESVYGNSLSVPLIRVNDYHLPSWVNQDSLVICSSYSGTTEETIQNLREALDKKAKIIVIASGGDLIDLAQKNRLPFYQILPTFNPCNQPRMAIGYSVIGQLALLALSQLISFSQTDVDEAAAAMTQIINNSDTAKDLALSLEHKSLIIISGKHLLGAAHVVKNQCNENAKHFCDLYDLPELNHHLMGGLQFPVANQNHYHALLINSSLYSERMQKRLSLTAEIIQNNQIETSIWKPKSATPLSQTFETIQFGAYLVYYLVALHRLDPSPIPWVDYFKAKLKE